MIERFYLKNFLSFKEVSLEFKKGLIVFTGPSGSGKSILMDSILTSFSFSDAAAEHCESCVDVNLDLEEFGLENDDLYIFKHIKKEKSRFFINNQSLSKKSISIIGKKFIKHLSLKDYSDFSNNSLLDLVDSFIYENDKSFTKIIKKYKESYSQYTIALKKLEELKNNADKIEELKEFAAFEVQKIESINPSINEDEELIKIKKDLSHKEKLEDQISSLEEIFNFESRVGNFLDDIDVNSSFFDDTMNELRSHLESAQSRFEALEEMDIESVLDRLEELSGLKRRYGSIEEAIAYKEIKKKELAEYENIEFTLNGLDTKVDLLKCEITDYASSISKKRAKELNKINKKLNEILKFLYLDNAKLIINTDTFTSNGRDEISIELNNVSLNKISSGEFNRLRLAILTVQSEFLEQSGGVLMLDEIDANLSGEESMSVAKVLKMLSKNYQIFVISHQPQLTSMSDQHFLVSKNKNSSVKELDTQSRVNEIARMISGDKISNEAIKFASELLDSAS